MVMRPNNLIAEEPIACSPSGEARKFLSLVSQQLNATEILKLTALRCMYRLCDRPKGYHENQRKQPLRQDKVGSYTDRKEMR